MKTDIPTYTAEDYYTTNEPFEFLYQYRNSPFLLAQLTQRMAQAAKAVGVQGFLKMYSAFLSEVKREKAEEPCNVTEFSGQPEEYYCGSWTATEHGITGTDRFGMPVTACYHPILPIERLVNVDSGIHKVKLAYKLSGRWREVIEDKATISDGRAIIALAKYGINVTSDNAKSLVRFLADVEHLNYDRIPETASVGRLGWIDGYGFSPYDGNLVFDGDEEYRSRFEAVRSSGSPEKWLDCIMGIRENDSAGGKIARIVMAASFASVLVKPCGCLPFFVHLWGGSETGKTVSLLVAASAWADPEIGRYIQTFNATEVGKELGAAFCNSLPLIIDELQLVKDSRKDFDKMIYQLAEGVGRTRGRKNGGLQKTPTWKNCMITTGEFPIISENSGAGAINRTIEIDCHDTKLFSDAKAVAGCMYENYGFAGREFVERLTDDGNMDYARKLWECYADKLKTVDNMEKQTASAALILTADTLLNEWIFQDGHTLKAEDLIPFLKSKAQVDQNSRAVEYLEDFVAINQAKFDQSCETAEIWGRIDDGVMSIIKTKFVDILEQGGYNASAFLGWAKGKGLLVTSSDGKNTISKRVGGRVVRCVCLRQRAAETLPEDEILPL